MTALMLVGVPSTACAGISLTFGIDDIAGADWNAHGMVMDVTSASSDNIALTLHVASLQLPGSTGTVTDLQLSCAAAVHDDAGWHCRDGQVNAAATPWQPQASTWRGDWLHDGSLHVAIAGLTVAAGTLAVELDAQGPDWRAAVSVNRLSVKRLGQFDAALRMPHGWSGDGRVSGRVEMRVRETEVQQARVDAVVDRLTYASADGSQAGEGIVVKLDGTARRRGGTWVVDSHVRWPQGEVYSEPLHVDAAHSALNIDAGGTFDAARGRFVFDSWSIVLDKTLQLTGTGILDTAHWTFADLTVAVHSDDAQRVYEVLAQPYLLGTAADDMQVSGRVGFVLHYDADGVEQAGLELTDLALRDNRRRFALRRTAGHVAWTRDEPAPVSRLKTEGFDVYRIGSDAFDVEIRAKGDRVDLVEPIVIPVLGGSLALNAFAMQNALATDTGPRWTASAAVRDVSLDQLTHALDWPPFAGSLSGELRDMRYVDRVFSIGGGLEVAAFDGRIVVDGLTIADPLGRLPALEANATLRGLSLAAVTSTFAFGRIEGRLDADLQDLRLLAWQPEQFDLHLYTPADDDSRHRISQRAVQNLTELGSGVPAGLSSTFLGLFEEFNYKAIDLRILLRGNVAELDGLARDEGGYYLVRGSGLPRIDVIGRNRSVAWKDLVERLRQIRVEGVTIQ